MKQIEESFQKKVDGADSHLFQRIKQGVNSKGRNVYIYRRTHVEGEYKGKQFGIEVFIANMVEKGTSRTFPDGKTKIYEEDVESYPRVNAFGKTAWFTHSLIWAKKKFEELLNRGETEIKS